MTSREVWETPNLVLGFKMDDDLQPMHFGEGGRPGDHRAADVVETPPKTIGYHTVVIAQSGSGKSFFLGRLIEEILLKTRSRVLIFDQNSDFRKIAEVRPAEFWSDKDNWYSKDNMKGFLFHEPRKEIFEQEWKAISKRLHALTRETSDMEFEALKFDWFNFPIELLAEGTLEGRDDQLRHCHKLIERLARLARETDNSRWLNKNAFFECAEDFCASTRNKEQAIIVNELRKVFVDPPKRIPSAIGAFTGRDKMPESELEDLYEDAATHRRFVQDPALDFYFSLAYELVDQKLIDATVPVSPQTPHPRRLEIVDIASLPESRDQKLVMCTFLDAEWKRARLAWVEALADIPENDRRVPTFIVVEEAHNAMPANPSTPIEKRLQELFRRIAAEGRKFGLFLIIVSQRPDKLDRMIMSECENNALMRVSSSLVFQTYCEVLGLDGAEHKSHDVLKFDRGKVLLSGRWAGTRPTLLMSAARRTMEGGRDLNSDYWAQS